MVINNQTKIKSCRIWANIVAANAANDTKGSMGAAYMSQVISGNLSSHKGNLSPLYLYNKGQNYTLFMIPALLSIVMMLMTGFLPTHNIVGEKEAGTIEQINVTPVSKWTFILAAHTLEHVERTINAFKECKKKLDEGRYKAKVVDPWSMLKSGKVEF